MLLSSTGFAAADTTRHDHVDACTTLTMHDMAYIYMYLIWEYP